MFSCVFKEAGTEVVRQLSLLTICQNPSSDALRAKWMQLLDQVWKEKKKTPKQFSFISEVGIRTVNCTWENIWVSYLPHSRNEKIVEGVGGVSWPEKHPVALLSWRDQGVKAMNTKSMTALIFSVTTISVALGAGALEYRANSLTPWVSSTNETHWCQKSRSCALWNKLESQRLD